MSYRMESDKNVAKTREDAVSMVRVLTILGRQKKLVIGIPIVTGIAALAVSFLMTPIFVSTAVVMPPQQSQGSGAAAALLGQIGGLAGVGVGKSPSELYVGMLKSRTIADSLINEFKLKDYYHAKTMDEVRKKLLLASTIIGSKDTLISITVEDKDPKMAAQLANGYVSSLIKLNENLATSEAALRRKFFEQQMISSKNDLANAEVALAKIQENTGMIELEGQVKGLIANAAQLQGEIAAKEIQLSAMRSYAAKDNPELLQLQEQIRAMNAQMAQLTKGNRSNSPGLMIATGKIPQVGVEYVRGLREVKYYQAIFEVMAKQFELAKVDESKESAVIQELDKAIPADKKKRPVRSVILMMGVIGGLLLGVIVALLRDLHNRSRSSVEGQARWSELSTAWRSGK